LATVAPIPAICETCRRVFVSHNIIGGTATVTMVGSRVGPCPHCGGWGRIPDGVYDLADAVTTYFAAPSVPIGDLERLIKVFQTAQAQGASANEVADTIERELPSLEGLSEWLRRAGPVLAKALWPLLIAILVLMIQQRMERPTLTPDQVEQIITRVVEETDAPVAGNPPLPGPPHWGISPLVTMP
jgi:hypothetical protein